MSLASSIFVLHTPLVYPSSRKQSRSPHSSVLVHPLFLSDLGLVIFSCLQDLTTFVCVCIPEFLSLYETERLVQELTKFEIDTHNIIINQVLYDEEDIESKLLKARMKMQKKYVDQFYMLYDDFHITKLPLLPEEVCGVRALEAFSTHFTTPYKPPRTLDSVEGLERRIASLTQQLKEAEAHLDRLKKGKQIA
ncbi:hypothetical protein QQ045_022197 [Rhodiola kirilowii]